MTDYMPTTEVIRDAVSLPRERLGEPRPIKPEAFDRWLGRVKAEAWDEGKRATDTAWEHVYFGHPVPEGEICPECSTENPYRQEKK